MSTHLRYHTPDLECSLVHLWTYDQSKLASAPRPAPGYIAECDASLNTSTHHFGDTYTEKATHNTHHHATKDAIKQTSGSPYLP